MRRLEREDGKTRGQPTATVFIHPAYITYRGQNRRVQILKCSRTSLRSRKRILDYFTIVPLSDIVLSNVTHLSLWGFPPPAAFLLPFSSLQHQRVQSFENEAKNGVSQSSQVFGWSRRSPLMQNHPKRETTGLGNSELSAEEISRS